MEIRQNAQQGQWVESYTPGEFLINGQLYTHSVVINKTDVLIWPVDNIKALQTEHIQSLVDLSPELVLIGTGQQQHFIAHPLLAILLNMRIGVEVMATAKACRTFNLLTTEGRRVVAGLMVH